MQFPHEFLKISLLSFGVNHDSLRVVEHAAADAVPLRSLMHKGAESNALDDSPDPDCDGLFQFWKPRGNYIR